VLTTFAANNFITATFKVLPSTHWKWDSRRYMAS